MNSDTSSEDINVDYLDNNKISLNIDNLPPKNESTTDVYLNLVANEDKLREDENIELSENSNVLSPNSLSSNSNSIPVFEEVDLDLNSKDSKRRSKRESKKESYSSVKSSIRQEYYDNIPKLTPQQIRMKKIELLRKLSELKSKGYKLSKEYSFESPIEEMEYEFDLLKSFADKRNGVKLYKNLIVNAASVTEFANDKYDPFDFQLSGWSQHMNVEVDSYEDVLEELYEKYKGKGNKMSPELKLGLLVLFSASAFHFSKKHLSNVPGLNTVMKDNPDFLANLVTPKKQTSQYMSEQEISIENQKKELREKEKEQKRNNNNSSYNVNNSSYNVNNPSHEKPSYNVNNFMSNIDENENIFNINTPIEVDNIIQNNPNIDNNNLNRNNLNRNNLNNPNRNNLNNPNRNNLNRNNLNNPNRNNLNNPNADTNINSNLNNDVQNILNKLHDRVDDVESETQEESSIDNSRIVSDSISVSENGTKKKKNKKKPLMIIN